MGRGERNSPEVCTYGAGMILGKKDMGERMEKCYNIPITFNMGVLGL